MNGGLIDYQAAVVGFAVAFLLAVLLTPVVSQLAWMTAQDVLKAQGAGKPRMELAVGLRGISQYGPIMLGYFDSTATSPEDGLVKYLDDIPESEIVELNIPTGMPLVYELDSDLRPLNRYYLGDPAKVKAAMEAVAAQGKKK